jgi:hypothetical protein
MLTTERIIEESVRKFGDTTFKAPRKTKFICGPGFAGHVAVDSEMVLHLPNGATVRVHTDASGKATHVEENDSLHAIVRPDTYRTRVRA